MPCPSNFVASTRNTDVSDLLFIHPFNASSYFVPADKGQLVSAVMSAAQLGLSVRAIGTNWSLSEAGVAAAVVDTTELNRFIGQPFPNPGPDLPQQRLRGASSDFLARSCARYARTAGRHFIHIEAGIKIKQLLADLSACGLSIATMGDGAGQSVLGATSTGTHGADFATPMLAEWIRAIHLVGPTGQEVWITPADSPFGFPPLVTALEDWCLDTRFLADDDVFNAVRVGVGRFGVVYSIVLEVVPQYTLIEVSLEHRWSEMRAELAASRITGGGVTGVFNAPFRDFDSGWFRNEVLMRTYVPPNQTFTYKPGPPIWNFVPAYYDTHPQVWVDLLESLGLTTLSNDLRGGPVMPLHHMNLVFSLCDFERCWMRRRWKRSGVVGDINVAPLPDDRLGDAIKNNKTNPPGIVDALKERIEIGCLEHALGSIFEPTLVNQLDWYLDTEIPNIANQHLQNGLTSLEAIVLVLHRIATDPVLKDEAGPKVTRSVTDLIGRGFSRLARAGPASGDLNKNILDAHDYGLDGAQSGDSSEFHFDATTPNYLNFIDAVMAAAQKHFPVFGYIGVRFTPQATALIAMQQFALTASVEVATGRTRLLPDLFSDFWNEVHQAASDLGGIPHWGQEMRQTAQQLKLHYGERLTRWRSALGEIAGGAPQVFSTPFSRDKGLEPLVAGPPAEPAEDDALEIFMLALEAGVD